MFALNHVHQPVPFHKRVVLLLIAILLALILWVLIDKNSAVVALASGLGCAIVVVVVSIAGGVGAGIGVWICFQSNVDPWIGGILGAAIALYALWAWYSGRV
jgi:hypothetical protein